jgi:hypothetical protein
MRWALDRGKKVLATKGKEGVCPCCSKFVIAKCGELVTHHWAHSAGDCDPWYEPETAWHIGWKNIFPKEEQEVVIKPHRADVKTGHCVIELQNSPISPEEIREREAFYGRMIWIFNCKKQFENEQIYARSQRMYKEPYKFLSGVRWLHRKKSVLTCTKPVLLHLGKGHLINIYNFDEGFGYGHKISGKQLMKEVYGYLGSDYSVLHPLDYQPKRSAEAEKNVRFAVASYNQQKGIQMEQPIKRTKPVIYTPETHPDICPF